MAASDARVDAASGSALRPASGAVSRNESEAVSGAVSDTMFNAADALSGAPLGSAAVAISSNCAKGGGAPVAVASGTAAALAGATTAPPGNRSSKSWPGWAEFAGLAGTDVEIIVMRWFRLQRVRC